jgi:hypothetical protein
MNVAGTSVACAVERLTVRPGDASFEHSGRDLMMRFWHCCLWPVRTQAQHSTNQMHTACRPAWNVISTMSDNEVMW